MKKLTKLLSAVLVLAMVISLVPAASANAAKNYIFVNGTKTQVSKDKALTIWVGGKVVNLDYMINNKTEGISGKWSSSKPSVVKVTQTGKIKALKNGAAIITFKAKNGTKLKAAIYARTRATALNVNVNGANVNGQTVEVVKGKTVAVTIDMPVSAAAAAAGAASSYKVYPEVADSSVVSVLKVSGQTNFTINALKEGETKVTFVANYSKEANVRKNKYYKENYVNVKVVSDVTESAKQTAVNQITVTGKGLTNNVADYELKKDTAKINLASAVVSADGNSVVLTTASANPVAGNYTVTLKSGKVLSFTMEASAPKTIEFGKAATIVTGNNKQVKVTYKILDNFGKDVTSKYFSSATISGSDTVDKTTAGVILLSNKTTDYIAGKSIVSVNIICIAGTAVASGNQTYTVSAAANPYTVKVLGLYKLEGSNHTATTLMEGTVTAGQVYLALEVRDQYGDLMPVSALTSANLIVNVATATGAKFDTASKPVALKNNGAEFAAGYPIQGGTITNGTVTVIAIPVSMVSGSTKGEGTITIAAATKVASITNIASVGTLKVNSKCEFSFYAVDNNGAAVTSYDLLKNVSFSMSSGITMKWEKQSNGTAKLYGTPSTQYGVITAQPPLLGGQIYSTQFQAAEKSVPTSIGGFKSDASFGAVKGGTINVPLKYIIVYDQYSEVIPTDELVKLIAGGYGFEFTFGSNVAAVANAGSNGKPASADATLIGAAALAEGSNSLTIRLTKDGKALVATDFALTLYAAEVAGLNSFKVETPSLVYANGTKSDLAINVYGTMKSTGIKVKLNPSDYTVVLNPGVAAGTVENPGTDGKDGNNEFTVDYMIVVSDAEGAPTVNFKINYSEKSRVATTCEIKDGAHLDNNKEYTAAQIIAMFDFKDQYGDAISFAGGRVTVTGVSKNGKVNNNGTATMTVKDADVTLNIIFTNGSQTFTRSIIVY